jgi:hypothetical protein
MEVLAITANHMINCSLTAYSPPPFTAWSRFDSVAEQNAQTVSFRLSARSFGRHFDSGTLSRCRVSVHDAVGVAGSGPRDLIRERTRTGLKAAVARGRWAGTSPRLREKLKRARAPIAAA